jgi:hypothetical protein
MTRLLYPWLDPGREVGSQPEPDQRRPENRIVGQFAHSRSSLFGRHAELRNLRATQLFDPVPQVLLQTHPSGRGTRELPAGNPDLLRQYFQKQKHQHADRNRKQQEHHVQVLEILPGIRAKQSQQRQR